MDFVQKFRRMLYALPFGGAMPSTHSLRAERVHMLLWRFSARVFSATGLLPAKKTCVRVGGIVPFKKAGVGRVGKDVRCVDAAAEAHMAVDKVRPVALLAQGHHGVGKTLALRQQGKIFFARRTGGVFFSGERHLPPLHLGHVQILAPVVGKKQNLVAGSAASSTARR